MCGGWGRGLELRSIRSPKPHRAGEQSWSFLQQRVAPLGQMDLRSQGIQPPAEGGLRGGGLGRLEKGLPFLPALQERVHQAAPGLGEICHRPLLWALSLPGAQDPDRAGKCATTWLFLPILGLPTPPPPQEIVGNVRLSRDPALPNPGGRPGRGFAPVGLGVESREALSCPGSALPQNYKRLETRRRSWVLRARIHPVAERRVAG